MTKNIYLLAMFVVSFMMVIKGSITPKYNNTSRRKENLLAAGMIGMDLSMGIYALYQFPPV